MNVLGINLPLTSLQIARHNSLLLSSPYSDYSNQTQKHSESKAPPLRPHL